MREKSGTTFLLRIFFRHFGDRSWIFFLLKASYVRLSNNGTAGIIRNQMSTAAAKLADQRFLVGNGCSCDESVFDGTAAYINRTQKHKDFF